jgi:hypothetical protein
MLTTLYSLITNPIQFTTSHSPYSYKKSSFICLGIAGISTLVGSSYYHVIGDTLLAILCIGVVLAIHAIIIDFFAQFWGCSGQSLALFIGFSTTTIALGLLPPLAILKEQVPEQSPVAFISILSLCQWVIFAFIIYWQYRLIRSLYSVSKIKSIVLLISPYLLMMSFFGMLLLFVGFQL